MSPLDSPSHLLLCLAQNLDVWISGLVLGARCCDRKECPSNTASAGVWTTEMR